MGVGYFLSVRMHSEDMAAPSICTLAGLSTSQEDKDRMCLTSIDDSDDADCSNLFSPQSTF
jgi:hypothetical protein